jgi:hypothetical protein
MKVGDVVTTAREFDALPEGSIAVQPHGGILRRVEGSVYQQDAQAFLPATLVYLPGRPPRPERVVKAEALREAARAWQMNGWAGDLPTGSERVSLILGMSQRAVDFLLARADRIERDQ